MNKSTQISLNYIAGALIILVILLIIISLMTPAQKQPFFDVFIYFTIAAFVSGCILGLYGRKLSNKNLGILPEIIILVISAFVLVILFAINGWTKISILFSLVLTFKAIALLMTGAVWLLMPDK